MLKGELIQPDILAALGRAGHGAKILIADGNYPFSIHSGPKASIVQLNLSPGVVSCTQVLHALLTAIPVEDAAVMDYGNALPADPPIWAEFVQLLAGAGFENPLTRIERFEFYDVASAPDVALTIATGDQAIYANLLLTIGVVAPPG
ncbi:MAG TPA: transporter [Armatimonadetes bacterium]|nr:transporter [Armatimonadota bacterium]